MRVGFFIYNGNKYPSGTIIKVRMNDNVIGAEYITDACFCFVILESGRYVFKVRDKKYCYPQALFWQVFEGVTNSIDQQYVIQAETEVFGFYRPKKLSFTEELNIDGMFLAWLWYIFIMLVAIIFNDRLVIWIAASIIFFNYRKRKLRKEGYK